MSVKQSERDIARAVTRLRAGKLVGVPTETVYGLAADATNTQAVAQIFVAKGRPADHPLIVHLADASMLDAWARDVPAEARRLAAAFWPGPLTLILKRQPHVHDLITGGQDTVGLRVPNHALTLALLRAMAVPQMVSAAQLNGQPDGQPDGQPAPSGLAAPSANRYGRISPTCAADVRAELGRRVAMVLDGGACAVGIESTIVDLTRGKPRILRPGAISAQQIAAVLHTPTAARSESPQAVASMPRVSGSHAAHYAPRTPLRLLPSAELVRAARTAAQQGQRVAVLAHRRTAPANLALPALSWYMAARDAAGYAHDLYAMLRWLDARHCDLILVEALPSTEPWLAVADRLERAACGSGAHSNP